MLFNWKNLKDVKDGFAFILQNDRIQDGVFGVERFVNDEPVTLQLQVSLKN